MKYVYALIVLSLLTIALGVYLISQQPAPGPAPANELVDEPPRTLGVIPAPVPNENGNSEVPMVAPELGSEAWCDLMLQKANNLWTEKETTLFADQCIAQ